MIRVKSYILAYLLALAVCSPMLAIAQALPSGHVDSLKVALDFAERGGSCVTAFQMAARQMKPESPVESTPMIDARGFQTLAMIAHHGGDIGTSLVFSEAGLILATEYWGEAAPERGAYVLAHALALRLSGWTDSKQIARDLVDAALENAQMGGVQDLHTVADLEQAQANFTRAAHDLPKAIIQYEAALATRFQASPVHDIAVVDNEVWHALAVLNTGNIKRGRELFLHCREDLFAMNLAGHHLMIVTISALAKIANLTAQPQQAAKLYRQAHSRIDLAQRVLFAGFSQRRLATPLLNKLTYFALERGDYADAWRAFAAAHRNVGHQANSLKKARLSHPEFAARVQAAVINTSGMRGEVELSLITLRSASESSAARVRAVGVLKKHAQSMSKTYGLRDQLRSDFGVILPARTSVAQLQDRLAEGQAFLGYFRSGKPDPDRSHQLIEVTYAVVVKPGYPIRWTNISAPTAEIYAQRKSVIARYQDLMDRASEWPLRLPNDPEISRLLHELSEVYFEPIADQLTDIDEVFLLSTELPSGLSFSAMIDRNEEYLLERIAFQHIIGIDDVGRDQGAAIDSDKLSLVLGDPLYRPDNDTEERADPSLNEAISIYAHTVLSRSMVAGVLKDGESGLSRLPRLANSGWEARGIASMTAPVVVLTREQATEQNLFQLCGGSQLRSFKWIHLASHALVHRIIPEQSALALSPRDGQGLLYVEEIGFGWTLDCDLVTFSGCQTGRGPSSVVSGPLGFIQALHVAGARHLLLSTAKVDDIATALLMERFYANLANRSSPRVSPAPDAPLTYSFALAEAQRWLRDLQAEDGHRPFEHPVYWANFTLYGGG